MCKKKKKTQGIIERIHLVALLEELEEKGGDYKNYLWSCGRTREIQEKEGGRSKRDTHCCSSVACWVAPEVWVIVLEARVEEAPDGLAVSYLQIKPERIDKFENYAGIFKIGLFGVLNILKIPFENNFIHTIL